MVNLFYICRDYHMNAEEKILEGAQSMFLRYGIRSITMDEVSRELGISKKTLYQHVDNKADLVKKVMERHFKEEREFSIGLQETAENSIDEMLQVFHHMAKLMREISHAVVYDMQKYYPESWALQVKFKDEFLYNTILKNIQRGQKEGLYRANANADIIAKLYISSVEVFTDPTIFPVGEYTFLEIYTQFIQYHIYGLLTDEGRAYFEQRFKPE